MSHRSPTRRPRVRALAALTVAAALTAGAITSDVGVAIGQGTEESRPGRGGGGRGGTGAGTARMTPDIALLSLGGAPSFLARWASRTQRRTPRPRKKRAPRPSANTRRIVVFLVMRWKGEAVAARGALRLACCSTFTVGFLRASPAPRSPRRIV